MSIKDNSESKMPEWMRKQILESLNANREQEVQNNEIHSKKNITDPHLKGYIYDSLVFRYIAARKEVATYRILAQLEEQTEAYKAANRDILRFCEILNEAIGEHD